MTLLTLCQHMPILETASLMGKVIGIMFTARNEVGARLYFHRPSVILLTEGLFAPGGCGIPTYTEADTPLEQTPQTRHPPPTDPPRADTPPGADTPWSRHPPEQTPPWDQTPPGTKYTPSGLSTPPPGSRLRYTVNARAYGTHPTYLLSYFFSYFHFFPLVKCMVVGTFS